MEFQTKFIAYCLQQQAKKLETDNFSLHILTKNLTPLTNDQDIENIIRSLAIFTKKLDGFGSIYCEVQKSNRKIKAFLVFGIGEQLERACIDGGRLLDKEFIRTQLNKDFDTVAKNSKEHLKDAQLSGKNFTVIFDYDY